MDVKHFPIFIEENKLPEDVLRIIKHVKEDWNQEDVKFKVNIIIMFLKNEI